MRESVAQIDFETRSTISLRAAGSWRYSLDRSTEVLCLAFRLPHWPAGQTGLWNGPATLDLDELFQWIWAGRPIEAHNAWFERGIWTNKMQPDGWPPIHPWQWRCSAAKAAAHTLPRGLKELAAVLRLSQQKDNDGHALMMKMCKPRKPRKAERAQWAKENGTAPQSLLWWETPTMLERLYTYCRQDVLTEATASAAIPDLLPAELELYLMDQDINTRGFQLDMGAVQAALAIIAKETPQLNQELALLTGGLVQKATQRAKMLGWLSSQGTDLLDTQKETVEDALGSTCLTVPARRGLELMKMLGKASTAKYTTMRAWACPDGRVRGGLLFHGAGTGRWSGAGVQPHNFVRGIVKNLPALWDVLKTQNRKQIQEIAAELSQGKVTDVLDALSQALRGVVVAPPGRQLYCIDATTRVLQQDLTWVSADQLTVGSQLLAFDEQTGQGKGHQRKFKPASVLSIKSAVSSRYRVHTTHGTIIVSANHRFITRQNKKTGGWTEAQHLKLGDQLAFLSAPWKTETSYDAGYLAGFLDGEGHVSGHRVGWAQKAGRVFDRVSTLLTERRFDFSYDEKKVLRKVNMRGGLGEQLRLLGSLRPRRLLSSSQVLWTARRVWGQRTPTAVVTQIEQLPVGTVWAIETSTHTLITEGFLSHNCADYAAIEARCVLWLANDQEGLDIFRRNEDIYRDMAASIYGVSLSNVTGVQRQVGKFAILGLGFQMGASKFTTTCAKFGVEIEEDFAQQVVTAYRERFWRVRDMWADQEAAAIQAVQFHSKKTFSGKTNWFVEGDYLYCELPSGRRLAYPEPLVKPWLTSWGSMKTSLTFTGIDPFSRKWKRRAAYGGLLVENITQAVARDIMAGAIRRCEDSGVYDVVLSVHDELLCEANEDAGSVAEFVQLMVEAPTWATNCPIAAEGFSCTRYHK